MTKIHTKRSIIFTVIACTALVLSGCGSKSTESAGDEVNGRVSAFSDSEITVEVFQKNDGSSEGRPERQDAASGGAVGNGEQPPEKPSESMKPDGEAAQGENPPDRPSESMKPDGEAPQGEQPPENPDAASGGAVGNGEKPSGQMPKGESKTYTITDDTKFYENDGDSTTEISLNDLELGGDVTLVLDSDGKNVVSVTKQQRQQGNMRSDGKNGNDTGKENQSSK